MEHRATFTGFGVSDKLAILGGPPVHVRQWPSWPRAGRNAQRALLNVLHSGKWALSGRSIVMPSQERQFGDAFARYVGRRYAVPCASGTAALSIALQSLGVGPGDEVVVPALTWVACASAVMFLGAIPVLVDINAETLCPTVEAVAAAISPATRAVLGVHMYSSRMDTAALEELCATRGVAMIEDASQAHGAMLGSQRIGGFGDISVFSFQQSKLLTCGEGGIATTDDYKLYTVLQQLRADGRIYAHPPHAAPFQELTVGGDAIGRNFCLSEFHAAILHEGLERLDVENDHRRQMAAMLTSSLSRLGWVEVVQDTLSPASARTHYKVPLRITDEAMADLGPKLISSALTAELNLPVEPLDVPLTRSPLYRPETSALAQRLPGMLDHCRPDRFSAPLAEAAWRSTVALPHQALMGSEVEIAAILQALAKVRDQAPALREWEGERR